MRWSLLALLAFVMACEKATPTPTPIAEPTFAIAPEEASTKPFAVNPDPNLSRGIALLTDVRAAT